MSTTATAAVRNQKPPVVGGEQVTCACGHAVKFESFPGKPDKYRDERRKKLADRPCPQCRAEAHEKTIAEQKAKAELRKAELRKQPKASPPQRFPGRLPHASEFHAVYDAETKTWSGTLTIEGAVFTGKFDGVFRLMHELDNKYREAAKQVTEPAAQKQEATV
jgi:hypothetical protein